MPGRVEEVERAVNLARQWASRRPVGRYNPRSPDLDAAYNLAALVELGADRAAQVNGLKPFLSPSVLTAADFKKDVKDARDYPYQYPLGEIQGVRHETHPRYADGSHAAHLLRALAALRGVEGAPPQIAGYLEAVGDALLTDWTAKDYEITSEKFARDFRGQVPYRVLWGVPGRASSYSSRVTANSIDALAKAMRVVPEPTQKAWHALLEKKYEALWTIRTSLANFLSDDEDNPTQITVAYSIIAIMALRQALNKTLDNDQIELLQTDARSYILSWAKGGFPAVPYVEARRETPKPAATAGEDEPDHESFIEAASATARALMAMLSHAPLREAFQARVKDHPKRWSLGRISHEVIDDALSFILSCQATEGSAAGGFCFGQDPKHLPVHPVYTVHAAMALAAYQEYVRRFGAGLDADEVAAVDLPARATLTIESTSLASVIGRSLADAPPEVAITLVRSAMVEPRDPTVRRMVLAISKISHLVDDEMLVEFLRDERIMRLPLAEFEDELRKFEKFENVGA